MNGFIKIERKILDWEWYEDTNTKVVFLHLLLTANWREREYKGMTIIPGQAVFSIASLSSKLHLSESKVRTALDHLKITGEITIKTTNHFSVATLENWAKYQVLSEDIADESQSNHEQIATPKEYKNKRTVFKPPTQAEVTEFIKENGYIVDPEEFWLFYEQKGWKTGKDTMKNWQAAVRLWDRRKRKELGDDPQKERKKYD